MIRIEVDVRSFEQTLSTVERQQLPFAASLAVNALAGDSRVLPGLPSVQRAVRDSVTRAFILRKPEYVLQSVKMLKFASKADPSAVIGIDPRRAILAKHEDQASTAERASRRIPVLREPGRGFRDVRQTIPPSLKVSAFSPFQQASFAGERLVLAGQKRTYLLKLATMTLLLQSTGRKGKRTSRVLYVWKRGPLALDRRLHFAVTARRVIAQEWMTTFHAAWAHALATAR